MEPSDPVDQMPDEASRVSALRDLHLVGTAPEAHFDALCRTAQRLFRAPIALVVLVADDRQWFKARCGLDLAYTPRDLAICSHTIMSDDVMVVEDASRDPRFADNALVTGEPWIRFYAGAPLILGPGLRVGTVCVVDTVARTFSAEDRAELADLATIAVAHLRLQEANVAGEAEAEQHRASEALLAERHLELQAREQGLRETNDLLSLAEEFAHVGHWRIDVDTGFVHSSAGFERIFGRAPAPGRFHNGDHTVVVHPDDRDRTRRKMDDLNAGIVDGYENRSRIVRPDGETRVIISRARAERDASGRVRFVFGVCMDITEAAQVEEQLREKTTLLSDTLDNMNQGLIVIDAQKRLSLINRPAVKLLDLPTEWMTSKPLHDDAVAHLTQRGESLPQYSAEARSDATGAYQVYERTRPNGITVEIRTVQLPDGSAIRTFADITARRKAEQALKESEANFRVLAESASDMITRRRADGTLIYVSPAAVDMLGYTPTEMLEVTFADLCHPDDLPDSMRAIEDLLAGRLATTCVIYRLRRKDGRWITVERTSRLVRLAEGLPAEVVSTARDVTERMAVADRLRENEARLALALDSGSDGLWDWNVPTGRVWTSGRCWERMRPEYQAEPSFELLMRNVVHPDDQAELRATIEECFRQNTALESEFRFVIAGGSFIWVVVRGRIVERAPDGAPLRMAGTLIDVTLAKEAQALITHMARHDALTDLPNRAQFRDQLGQRLAEVERNGGTLAVMCLDLDRFKAVNDILGHLAGDVVLREIAQRLRRAVLPEDTVARLGGDEFAILVASSNPNQPRRIDTLAERLVETVNEPILLDRQEVSVGLTIGIALAPGDGIEIDAIFKRADLAMYRAKAEGRNAFRFFEAGMDAALAERRRLELDLRLAISHHELQLHYQPVLDTSSGTFSGFEALLRWNHPERGFVSPADFIPIAEETGLIVPIGDWVLRTACREAMSWSNRSLKVSVNVSAVQFRQGGLIESVVSALASSGLPASRLELEITESVLIGNGDAVLATVQSIRAMGIRIALDDFGTGYSSLSYLHRFPFDRVKIDRSFVREIDSPNTAAIVRATVDLARRLGMAVTAEGIETSEQLRLVRAEGCTEIQGYLISRPVSAAAACAMAEQGSAEIAA